MGARAPGPVLALPNQRWSLDVVHDQLATGRRFRVLIRLEKENGWTSLRIDGGPEFKRAAYLSAAAQGLKVDGYQPDAVTITAADREQARQAGSTPTKEQAARTANQARDSKEQPRPDTDLTERFRRQTDVQNATDPELRKAQSSVALAMVVAGDRFPGDHTKQREFVAERKEEVAARIERGERIVGVEVKAKQDQQVRDMTQEVIYEKSRSVGGALTGFATWHTHSLFADPQRRF